MLACAAMFASAAVPANAATGPSLVSTSPDSGETLSTRPATVSATYSMALDTTPVVGSTISLTRGGTNVAGSQSFANGDTTIVFTPSSALLDGDYRAAVTAKDAAVPPHSTTTSWTFTVDTTPPPAPMMDALSPISSANVADYVITGDAPGSATVDVELRDYAGHSVTVRASRNGSRYAADLDATSLDDGQMRVDATGTDDVGNSLHNGNFTTKDTRAPRRASTTPPDGATAGAVKRVTLEYDEDLAPSTTVEVRDTGGAVRTGTTALRGRRVTLTLDRALNYSGSPYAVIASATDTVGNAGTTTTHLSIQAPGAGTPVCGTLPTGPTTWAASGAPYLVCPDGLTVPLSATLELDGSLGPFAVLATGSGGVHVDGGTLRTVSTSAAAAVTFDSVAGTAGSWAGIAETNRPNYYTEDQALLDLSYVVVQHAVVGVSGRFASGNDANVRTVTLDHVTVTDTSSHGMSFLATSLAVSSSSVARAGADGIRVDCYDFASTPLRGGWSGNGTSVRDTSVDHARDTGIDVRYCRDPRLTGNVVTASGTASPPRPAMSLTSWESYYGTVQWFRLGAPDGVSGNTGGGNGLDALAIAGVQHGALTWVTPIQSATAHPLGYVNLGLQLDPFAGGVFPPGSVVKSGAMPGVSTVDTGFRSGFLNLQVGTVTFGEGSVLTSVEDDSAGPATCTSVLSTGCTPGRLDWPGIIARGTVTATGTTIAHATTCFQGFPRDASAPRASLVATTLTVHDCADGILAGNLTLSGSTVTDIGNRSGGSGLGVHAVGSADVTDTAVARTDGPAVSIEMPARLSPGEPLPTARVERVSADQTEGVQVVNPWHLSPGYHDPVVRDVTVTRSPDWPVRIEAEGVQAGPGRHVDQLTGGGNGHDGVVFASVFTGGLTWVTPTNATAVHPLGYAGSFHMVGGTLVAPARSRMLVGHIHLTGATFDATAGDVVIEPQWYPYPNWYDLGLPPYTSLAVDPGATAEASRVLLSHATWRGLARLQLAPDTSPTPIVRIVDSTLVAHEAVYDTHTSQGGSLDLAAADSEIMRSTLTGFQVSATRRLHVADSALTWQETYGGIMLQGAGDFEVTRTRVTGIGYGMGYGLYASDGAVVTGTCNSFRAAMVGIGVAAGSAVTSDDSDVYGNAKFDVSSTGGHVQVRRVWWGQAGGPTDAQVEGDANVDASSPASAVRPAATVTTSSTARRSDGSYGAGTMTVRLAFSRRMNTDVLPHVTVTGSDGVAHPVAGSWQDTRTWSGAYEVTSSSPGGRNRVDARDARGCVNDPATNLMTPAHSDVTFATAPNATITSGPTTWSGSTATFAFTAGAAASFSCSTSGGWSACSSPVRFTGLPAGVHTFHVRATNSYGTGAAASRTWSVDTTAPAGHLTGPAAPFQTAAGVAATWTASDSGSGVHSTDLRYRTASPSAPFGGYVYPVALQRTTARSASVSVSAGITVCFSVRARDRVGHLSAWSPERCTARLLDDRALTSSGGWQRRSDTRYWNSTYTYGTASGIRLTRADITTDRVALLVTRCPTCGTFAVYVAGRYLGSVDLSATTTARVLLWLPRTTTSTGSVTVRVTSSGRPVEIDGIGVSRA
jgi:hypothetical protein